MAARLIGPVAGRVSDALATMVIALVRAYQWAISPWLGPRCRFQPTCSEYAVGAIRRFGPLRGGWMALKRVIRCHPWGASGYDPVPDRIGKSKTAP